MISLMSNVSKKDETAFQQLYELTYKRVFQYIYRLTNNQETAEDLLIDTYTEVWKSSEKFQYRSKVLTWVTGIARNLAMNEFRKGKIKTCEVDEGISHPPDQFDNHGESETTQILQEALNLLPLKHREVLDLVFLQDMRYEEISQVMNIPVNTVKTRVFHAKDKLQKILTRMKVKKDDLI